MFVLLPLPPAIWEWMRCDERPPGELRTKSHLLQDSGGNRLKSWNDERTCRPKHNLIIIYVYTGQKLWAGQLRHRHQQQDGGRAAAPAFRRGASTPFATLVLEEVLWFWIWILSDKIQHMCTWTLFLCGQFPFSDFRFYLPLPYGQQPAFNFPILVLTVLHIGAMPAARNVCSPQLSIRLSRMQVALLLMFGLPPIVFPGTSLYYSSCLWLYMTYNVWFEAIQYQRDSIIQAPLAPW